MMGWMMGWWLSVGVVAKRVDAGAVQWVIGGW